MNSAIIWVGTKMISPTEASIEWAAGRKESGGSRRRASEFYRRFSQRKTDGRRGTQIGRGWAKHGTSRQMGTDSRRFGRQIRARNRDIDGRKSERQRPDSPETEKRSPFASPRRRLIRCNAGNEREIPRRASAPSRQKKRRSLAAPAELKVD
jgi:hypothetical protein